MPRLGMHLEEQLSDTRSNEAAYRLKVENLGATSVDLLNLSPRIPEGVELIEVKDSSVEAAKVKHQEICSDLTELLRDQLFLTSKEVQNKILQINKEHVNEIAKDAVFIWRPYFKAFTGSMYQAMDRLKERKAAITFYINSKTDSDIALQKWFASDSSPNSLEHVFRAKSEQLEELEKTMAADTSATAIATIEPDSFFATTYVLQFPRSSINPRKFGFSVEASFSESENSKVHLDAASTTVVISPRPYVLSMLTMLSALLGVILKFAFEAEPLRKVSEFFEELSNIMVTGPGITAVILSLVIFNIYEYTGLSRNIRISVGWRSALLIGVVCGLFSERMVGALRVLVGA